MYLIFKRENPYGVVIFNSLDQIEKAVKNEIYGERKYDKKNKMRLQNDYIDFTIIKNLEFPYKLCDNNSYIKNIILHVNQQKKYYLLDEHHYAHGVWDYSGFDGKKLIFNDLIEMKKYCENVVNQLSYLNGYYDNDRISDLELINLKFNKLKDYQILDSKTEPVTETASETATKTISLELQEKIDYCNGIDENEDKIHFSVGNDFYVDFTISKILPNNN